MMYGICRVFVWYCQDWYLICGGGEGGAMVAVHLRDLAPDEWLMSMHTVNRDLINEASLVYYIFNLYFQKDWWVCTNMHFFSLDIKKKKKFATILRNWKLNDFETDLCRIQGCHRHFYPPAIYLFFFSSFLVKRIFWSKLKGKFASKLLRLNAM